MAHTKEPLGRRFAGRKALVTGAGSGIGRAVALRLAAEGARLCALDLMPDAAQETADLIRAADGEAQALACDVGDAEAVRSVFAGLERLDVLVNSAGIAQIGKVEQTTAEDMDRLYRVNVKGVYHTLHFGMPLMRRGGGGAIVNLASIASKIGIADRFAYSMSKGAVLAMTLSVARDYLRDGIRCNCLCPARIHTPFVDGYLKKNYPNDEQRMFEQLSAF